MRHSAGKKHNAGETADRAAETGADGGRMKQEQKAKRILFIRIGLLAAAGGFIALGLARQEHLTILQKAIYICMECIGLG